MTCAEDLSPPRKEYFEFEAHPPSMMLNDPIDESARIYKIPMLRFAIEKLFQSGMTATVDTPAMTPIIGAMKKIGLSARAGIMSSLKNSFRASATG
jgi:hypothetical protein